MIIKVPTEMSERLKAQDTTVIGGVLEFLDAKLIEQLKQSKEDVRYIQGYSAAVDMLKGLIKK